MAQHGTARHGTAAPSTSEDVPTCLGSSAAIPLASAGRMVRTEQGRGWHRAQCCHSSARLRLASHPCAGVLVSHPVSPGSRAPARLSASLGSCWIPCLASPGWVSRDAAGHHGRSQRCTGSTTADPMGPLLVWGGQGVVVQGPGTSVSSSEGSSVLYCLSCRLRLYLHTLIYQRKAPQPQLRFSMPMGFTSVPPGPSPSLQPPM